MSERPGFGMHRPHPGMPQESTGSAGAAPPAPLPPLPPDATVDLERERSRSGIDEVLAGLDDELVGLATVKARVREIAAVLLIDRMRARFGLPTTRPNLHMCFTGSPGTGKTTVAVRLAGLLHRLGYLRRGHLVTATRDDLIGQYVGHTAPKTKEVLKRAMGGVLFIDEAYHLYRVGNERDYGQEAIEILLQVMENHRDDLVVMLAGYADRMEAFFSANPGMSSRVGHHIDFPDYTGDELEAIGALMLRRDGYELAPEAGPVFRDYLDRRRVQPRFANARSVRNALERARLRHAYRLVMTGGEIGRAELTTLRPEDFLASRVFTDASARPARSRAAANGDAAERSR
ncbi:AAA family ATPase [Thermopolyspora sp. NPDC052614]|uniref:AAA family ATPase n=1 Tax=Thermopolyspora sp. NPDC052614 TaxID=3155682 RepID=UPI00342DC391